MIEQLMSLDFVADLSLKLDLWLRAFNTYLSGANNLKVVSLILMMVAIVLFLFLIIVIYVRNIIYFVKSNNPAKNINNDEDEAETVFDDEEQQELERELQRELELALAERQNSELQMEEKRRIEQENTEKQEKIQKAEQKRQKKAEKEEAERKELETEKVLHERQTKGVEVDFDWQKGKIPPAEFVENSGGEVSLSYEQSQKELSQLVGLVIDMLGRGVDDLKIAQTINFKNQGLSDENDILKMIDSIKQFIDLCISGKFAKLPQYDELPQEEQALYHLANGDPSLALALMENLMDTNIDRANASGSEEKRQLIYTEVSNYACCFGSLSEMNDIMLATSAYELAIELRSTNVTAWSRLGDVYREANSMSKAVWAYQNVLNFADGEIEIAQIANANNHLSEHLYAEGNSLQAAKLYNSAKQYYDSLGISRRLDKQEIEIIEIIESNQQSSLQQTIRNLLNQGREIA